MTLLNNGACPGDASSLRAFPSSPVHFARVKNPPLIPKKTPCTPLVCHDQASLFLPLSNGDEGEKGKHRERKGKKDKSEQEIQQPLQSSSLLSRKGKKEEDEGRDKKHYTRPLILEVNRACRVPRSSKGELVEPHKESFIVFVGLVMSWGIVTLEAEVVGRVCGVVVWSRELV